MWLENSRILHCDNGEAAIKVFANLMHIVRDVALKFSKTILRQ